MGTGLFHLFESVNSREEILQFLDSSSFDELIEFDINKDCFINRFHTSEKYVSMLPEGSYRDLFVSLSELTVHPEDRERFCEFMDPQVLNYHLDNSKIRGLLCEEFRFRLLNENWCWVELIMLSKDFAGSDDNKYRIYVYDINSKKMRESGKSRSLDYFENGRNELTGLLKKSSFIKEVELLTKDTGVNWCFIAIDIDNFKLYNEWYGRSGGDFLMAQLGTKLKNSAELYGGTAGYFGQDDFCMLTVFDRDMVDNLYADISSMVSAEGDDTGFKPAFGICLFDPECEVRDMIDRAFLALRSAKQSYRRRIRLFDAGMYSKEDSEFHILGDFMRALKKGEITFYFQPQCRASTGKIVGAEALCRWILPDGSMVSPAKFIPLLEKRGLITDLDMYIWEEVCKWQSKWITGGNTPLPVSVNISTEDIVNVNLSDVFTSLTEKYGLPHDLINIEITESAYSSNAMLIKEAVHELHDKGFTVLMDDFGSGYSTLNMLSNLSVDILKLDAQFLALSEDNTKKGIQILESVTTMSKTIGIPVVVEGVETENQKIFLEDMGCSYIQGYYFYRPMEISKYEELIADHNNIDTGGVTFKPNQQFQVREILDSNVYTDTMLNNILGACAIYSMCDDKVDIIRFNQQFYRAVDVPDFMDRLENIERFVPPLDIDRMHMLLRQAKQDSFNGSSGLLHFYKTDGTLTTFFMRFYYLKREEDKDIFYGSVQNITRLSKLEKQIQLLSRFSNETIVFLTRKPDGNMSYSVLYTALEKETGRSREQLEMELNRDGFIDNPVFGATKLQQMKLLQHINNSESFDMTMDVLDTEGKLISLNVRGDNVVDNTNTVDYIMIIRKKND